DVLALERRAIFDRSWMAVAREEELQAPGQHVVTSAGLDEILVTRGSDLRLYAFHNVCRHRGSPVVAEPALGRVGCFTCPYHGWTYELDGTLRTAPHAPAGFDRAEHGLLRVQVEAWEGF